MWSPRRLLGVARSRPPGKAGLYQSTSFRRANAIASFADVPYSAVAPQGPREVLDKVVYTLLNLVSAGLVRRPERHPPCGQCVDGEEVWFIAID